jgi:hypothetical protein
MLAVWVLSSDWLCQKLKSAMVVRHLGEATTLGVGVCGLCPILASSYTLEFALQLSKYHGKTSVRASKKCSAYQRWVRFICLTWPLSCNGLDWPADPHLSWLLHWETGSILGQHKYLPSCRTTRFPTSANFESKLTVRALMWLANSGTPRSSWICLLLRCQGALVTRRRHFNCNTSTLWTWVCVTDLQLGHA